MKFKAAVCAILPVFISLCPAVTQTYTHYTSDYLRLRSADDTNASVITVLEPYLGVEISTHGKEETIDGIKAGWVKIHTANGYTGWCFSGYLKPVESDVSGTLVNWKKPVYISEYNGERTYETSVSYDEVQKQQGYYIQQQKRSFQDQGRAPEILRLTAGGGNVSVSEIDVVDGSMITVRSTPFTFDGKTFSHNKSRLVKAGGEINIFYLEHIPEKEWLCSWEYGYAYSSAGGLSSKLPAAAVMLTGDYLKNYAGTYVFDSCTVIQEKNTVVKKDSFEKDVIHVQYDNGKKCLSTPWYDLCDITRPGNGSGAFLLDFVETSSFDPFYWEYGEGAGYDDQQFFFYKGGIAVLYMEENCGPPDRDASKTEIEQYVLFFRKVQQEAVWK